MADGDIATRCHGNNEPRARQDERVDQSVCVYGVPHPEVVSSEGERSVSDERFGKNGHAEEGVGQGEGHQAVVGRPL